jgi:beta-N-acetylhexosaminidase
MGYEGIVVAGPMDSQEVTARLDAAEAAIRALEYGADMIFWNGADTREMRAVDKIVAAVNEGRLSEARINESLQRVLQHKFDHRVEYEALRARDAAPLEKRKRLAQQVMAIEQRAITLVKNDNNILPLREEKSMPVGITGTIGVETLHKRLEKHFKPISQQLITTARHLGEIQDFEIERVTGRIRGLRTVVCIFGETERPEGQVKLIRGLKEKGVQVVVIHLGYPRNVPLFREADAILLAYCDSSKYMETVAAMTEVLVGEGPVNFVRIDREIQVPVGEARTFNAYDILRVPAGRLPVTLGPDFRAGLAVRYDPRFTVKKVQWDFGGGKRSKDVKTVHAFDTPGNHAVTLSVTTEHGDTESTVFHVVADQVQ